MKKLKRKHPTFQLFGDLFSTGPGRSVNGVTAIAIRDDNADELKALFFCRTRTGYFREEIRGRQIDFKLFENGFDVERKFDGGRRLHLPLGGGYTGSLHTLSKVI